MHPIDSNEAEAQRLLAVAQRFLHAQNFNESRDFAVLAQENDPLLEGSDQILAVADVLMASQKKVNNHPDWYSLLQVNSRSDDFDLIKRQYRRLALLLHPDKNRFPFSGSAFRLISDAWRILSDPLKKSVYDNEIEALLKVDAFVRNEVEKDMTFWTVCPYCYNLYEYPYIYLDCCFKCQKCRKAFHGVVISPLPQIVPGQDAYYCRRSFFPMINNSISGADSVLPSQTVPPPPPPQQAESANMVDDPNVSAVHAKKRGRPRKNEGSSN